MVQIRTVDLAEAQNRLKGRATGSDARAPYREAITNLSGSRMLELEPDTGESMRLLKLNVTRSANEVNRPVSYGESNSGTLLVWLQEKPKQKRGPRKPRTE